MHQTHDKIEPWQIRLIRKKVNFLFRRLCAMDIFIDGRQMNVQLINWSIFLKCMRCNLFPTLNGYGRSRKQSECTLRSQWQLCIHFQTYSYTSRCNMLQEVFLPGSPPLGWGEKIQLSQSLAPIRPFVPGCDTDIGFKTLPPPQFWAWLETYTIQGKDVCVCNC